MPDTLPDDPAALRQLLLSLREQVAEKDGQILQLREKAEKLLSRKAQVVERK
ncbi:hypothetical protein [Azotobacter salinestris]|uniref:hypothetical protein n=1 Tax=Azotobacter salinestris TaxID=69964 RepID=UPI0032E00A74